MKTSEVLAKIVKKVKVTNERIGAGIPYLPENQGRYPDMGESDIAWWTNGFYSGMLWQLYHEYDEPLFRHKAIQIEERLDQALEEFVDLHHDVGFMWLHTAVAHDRNDGHQQSKLRGIKAASLLAGRFNLKGGFLRAWNLDHYGWTIIDSMMNIPLLYWASEESGDPRFRQIAEAHADTVAAKLVRTDASVGHIGSFDPASGEFLELLGGQGFDGDSAWSRGQSWALYGFALAYRHSGNENYLSIAKKVANYFLANVSQTDYVPRIDFKAPVTEHDTDTSAGLIATCGLLELAQLVTPYEAESYRSGAEKILTKIVEEYCDFDPEYDGIVTGGAVAYHGEHDVRLIYADYFLVEALLRLQERESDLW